MRIPAVVAMTLAVLATAANANPTSYVASYGNDANACQLATPCRSFTAALAQTQLNGQIVALDVAGYGPVTINQPVTLTAARGIYAAITGSTGAAVTIDAVGSVVLRGLTLTGLGAAQGIAVVNSTDVTIDHCTIAGFAAEGIAIGSGATGNVVIRDTSIDHSGTSAIAINNAVSARVLVDRADIAASGLASVAPGISLSAGQPDYPRYGHLDRHRLWRLCLDRRPCRSAAGRAVDAFPQRIGRRECRGRESDAHGCRQHDRRQSRQRYFGGYQCDGCRFG